VEGARRKSIRVTAPTLSLKTLPPYYSIAFLPGNRYPAGGRPLIMKEMLTQKKALFPAVAF
jgi:hypothetical protein